MFHLVLLTSPLISDTSHPALEFPASVIVLSHLDCVQLSLVIFPLLVYFVSVFPSLCANLSLFLRVERSSMPSDIYPSWFLIPGCSSYLGLLPSPCRFVVPDHRTDNLSTDPFSTSKDNFCVLLPVVPTGRYHFHVSKVLLRYCVSLGGEIPFWT